MPSHRSLGLTALFTACSVVLAACNFGYATWKEKSISVTSGTGGMEISTADDAARIFLGSQVIVLTDDSVSVNGEQRPAAKGYKKIVVTESAGVVKVMLDGTRVF
jgi:hypothetical protein